MTDDLWSRDVYPSPERVAELAQLYPVGGYLTVTDPWPIEGWITDRTEHGVILRHPDGQTGAFLAWWGLASAKVERR